MGYILPIQQHEYAEYQKRMVTRKRTVSTVERPFRVIFESAYEELSSDEELREQKLEVLPRMEQENRFSDITGKGQYVDEHV